MLYINVFIMSVLVCFSLADLAVADERREKIFITNMSFRDLY